MFSATFPRQMEALARKILTKPIEVIKRADKALFCSLFISESLFIRYPNPVLSWEYDFILTSGFIVLFQIQVGGRSVVCSDVQQNVVCTVEPLLSGHPLLCSQLLKSRTYCQYNTVTVLLIIISFFVPLLWVSIATDWPKRSYNIILASDFTDLLFYANLRTFLVEFLKCYWTRFTQKGLLIKNVSKPLIYDVYTFYFLRLSLTRTKSFWSYLSCLVFTKRKVNILLPRTFAN